MSYSQGYKQRISELIAQSEILFQNTEDEQQVEKLLGVIENIISVSKLEFHPEVLTPFEYLKDILYELTQGSLLPTESTVSTISYAAQVIKRNLSMDLHNIDPSLIEKLKATLKTAKKEEHDYVFVKTLRVLLIDPDEFAQSLVKNNMPNSIQIESCFSGKEALARLQNEAFDAVLCELKLPDLNALDILKYSTKMPIIAISSSEDSKLVQLATKAGAVDYIVKNEDGIKFIPRSLHTVANQWMKKRTHPSEQLFSNPLAKKILKHLLNGDGHLMAMLDSKVVFEPKIAENDNMVQVLDLLVIAGFLNKKLTEIRMSCPKCNALNITIHYSCQKCNASDFIQGSIIEHNSCGHTDLESKFHVTNRLVCPKCTKELKLIGVDYVKIELAYQCKNCSNLFTAPSQTYSCNECKHQGFKISEGRWGPLYNYVLNPAKITEIKKTIVSLEPIKNLLVQQGYDTKLDHKIETKHQIFGPFDLIAQKEKNHILITVLGSDLEENFSKLVELDNIGKTIEDKISRYAIMFTEPSEVTRNLITKFGIMSVIVTEENKLLEKFKESTSSYL